MFAVPLSATFPEKVKTKKALLGMGNGPVCSVIGRALDSDGEGG